MTFANGNTKFVKSACSTEASPSNNKFVQSLYASNDYADSGYHNYDCLYLNWEGSSVKRVQYSLFISGSGSNFTAFFNTEGETNGIDTKTALVISGTKTSSGIKNLYYAFVMVEKGADPNGEVMAEGIFRVFKDQDGMSYATTRVSVVYDDCEYTMVGRLK